MANRMDTYHGRSGTGPYDVFRSKFEDAVVLSVDPKALTATVSIPHQGAVYENVPIYGSFYSEGYGNLSLPAEGSYVTISYSNFMQPSIICSPGRRILESVYSDILNDEQIVATPSEAMIKQGKDGSNLICSKGKAKIVQIPDLKTTEIEDMTLLHRTERSTKFSTSIGGISYSCEIYYIKDPPAQESPSIGEIFDMWNGVMELSEKALSIIDEFEETVLKLLYTENKMRSFMDAFKNSGRPFIKDTDEFINNVKDLFSEFETEEPDSFLCIQKGLSFQDPPKTKLDAMNMNLEHAEVDNAGERSVYSISLYESGVRQWVHFVSSNMEPEWVTDLFSQI